MAASFLLLQHRWRRLAKAVAAIAPGRRDLFPHPRKRSPEKQVIEPHSISRFRERTVDSSLAHQCPRADLWMGLG